MLYLVVPRRWVLKDCSSDGASSGQRWQGIWHVICEVRYLLDTAETMVVARPFSPKPDGIREASTGLEMDVATAKVANTMAEPRCRKKRNNG
jgi:hypothetical protein